MDIFYVDKTTHTPADALLAFGLAALLAKLTPEGQSPELTINDAGDSYRLEVINLLPVTHLDQLDAFPLFRGLNTAKKNADVPRPVDYLMHQRNNQTYFDSREKGISHDELGKQGITPPVPDWPVWAVVNQMAAIGTYNKLAELWYAHQHCFPILLELILEMYRERPNRYAEAIATWKKLAKENSIAGNGQIAQLQVVNPGMGKGGNRSKATGLSIGGLKGFWISEYLKFAGMFSAALPRTVSGKKDRKTYVIQPKKLSWETHQQVFPKFQETLRARTAAQMDILATLGYCEVYLKQWKAGQGTGMGWLTKSKPGNHVAALDVIFYKHLGSAHATMNLSNMVLPDWLPGEDLISTEQADKFLSVVEEHENMIRFLEEKFGDQEAMLRSYRDFLSARDLRAFYRFNRKYIKYIMRKLVPGVRYTPRRFTTTNLEVLIMAHEKKYQPILQNQGFLSIADAIRRSTVIPQYQKARGKNSLYDIRYGLGDKLLRHAHNKDKFVQGLSRFMHDYNRENARKSETRKQQFRKNITIDNINEIVALIDEFDTATVGNLLVAYGYARDPKTTSDKTDS
ncbi:MAG: hypothetical protein GY805_15640 [Chloroflexi bacterium]|nr:hypothetical protein [Chloroflexota bacterium]